MEVIQMDRKLVTCKNIGVYKHVLTKGNCYEIVDEDNDKFRIKGDHGRRVWISKDYFIVGKVEVPVMINWEFDDELEDFDLVEVTINFSNGMKRWCLITTPHRLVKHFEQPNLNPPGCNIRHLIIVKSMNFEDINKTLKYLDEQGELEEATIQLL